jgi:TonB family protein
MAEVWTKWEGEVVNGAFPLHRLLADSDHSGVFLTEYRPHDAQYVVNAAIKIVPADPALAEAQLSIWRMASTLSHAHLIRLLDAGQCQLGGRPFLFVVMEIAEQTLSQILVHRALTAEEVREMLPPTLDALAFLHRNNLVQGQLKPPNFLVVKDQLKLASDTIRPVGVSTTSIVRSSSYDPPEAGNGRISPAGDIWALGITMVEALTQHPPAWPDEASKGDSLPAGIPAAFGEIVRRCLSRNPAERPTVTDLEARMGRSPQPAVASSPPPVVPKATGRPVPPPQPARQRWAVQSIALLVILLAAAWAGWHHFRSNPDARNPASGNSQPSSPSAASPQTAPQNSGTLVAPAPDRPAPASANAAPSVLHQEIPDVPRSARETIHGQFNVSVRVRVDRSGNVVDATLEDPGPSRYFARLATAAARKWKFAPADNQDAREWLLWFEFTRTGATGHAAAPRP